MRVFPLLLLFSTTTIASMIRQKRQIAPPSTFTNGTQAHLYVVFLPSPDSTTSPSSTTSKRVVSQVTRGGVTKGRRGIVTDARNSTAINDEPSVYTLHGSDDDVTAVSLTVQLVSPPPSSAENFKEDSYALLSLSPFTASQYVAPISPLQNASYNLGPSDAPFYYSIQEGEAAGTGKVELEGMEWAVDLNEDGGNGDVVLFKDGRWSEGYGRISVWVEVCTSC
ncbi:hypothetical protein BT69DRAFT_1276998 [Atractiella rhizophila]|nr:hypothetical protein BT69DRAFT_1276998 [Atractiella rhizophila]